MRKIVLKRTLEVTIHIGGSRRITRLIDIRHVYVWLSGFNSLSCIQSVFSSRLFRSYSEHVKEKKTQEGYCNLSSTVSRWWRCEKKSGRLDHQEAEDERRLFGLRTLLFVQRDTYGPGVRGLNTSPQSQSSFQKIESRYETTPSSIPTPGWQFSFSSLYISSSLVVCRVQVFHSDHLSILQVRRAPSSSLHQSLPVLVTPSSHLRVLLVVKVCARV